MAPLPLPTPLSSPLPPSYYLLIFGPSFRHPHAHFAMPFHPPSSSSNSNSFRRSPSHLPLFPISNDSYLIALSIMTFYQPNTTGALTFTISKDGGGTWDNVTTILARMPYDPMSYRRVAGMPTIILLLFLLLFVCRPPLPSPFTFRIAHFLSAPLLAF